jgi:hypothetical protein
MPISQVVICEIMTNDYEDCVKYKDEIHNPKLLMSIKKELNDENINDFESLKKKYGILISTGLNDYDSKRNSICSSLSICFDEKINSALYRGALYKGEVTAGISKKTMINEIRQLFGENTKQKYSLSNNNEGQSYYRIGYSNILNNLDVYFVFNTSLKHTIINDKITYVDENGKMFYSIIGLNKSEEIKYVLNLVEIEIEKNI